MAWIGGKGCRGGKWELCDLGALNWPKVIGLDCLQKLTWTRKLCETHGMFNTAQFLHTCKCGINDASAWNYLSLFKCSNDGQRRFNRQAKFQVFPKTSANNHHYLDGEFCSALVVTCVLASFALKYLLGRFVWQRCLLLLLDVFVMDEIVKVGLIPGNLGQRSENKLLEKRILQHSTHSAYETVISLVLWANKYLSDVKVCCSDWSYSRLTWHQWWQ